MNPYYLTDMPYGFNGHDYSSGSASPSINPAHTGGHGAANHDVSASASHAAPNTANSGLANSHTNAQQAAPVASASTSNANSTPVTSNPLSGPLVLPHQDLNEFLESFWTRQMDGVEGETPDFKTYNLPLARIKKVMKSDEEVKMISAEAPIMFSKACEIFISELTCRAWLVAEGHKRRTLQKSDVASAIAFSDVFDFLIDIVPRDDGEPATAETEREREREWPAEEAAPLEHQPEEEYDRGGEDLYSEYVREGEGY